MGKAFEDIEGESDSENVDNHSEFDGLCAYLKLYNARSRCILLFKDCTYDEFEKNRFDVADPQKALEGLNPFLKYRLLVVMRDKMVTGSELMLKLVNCK
jgi:hypothetical protein